MQHTLKYSVLITLTLTLASCSSYFARKDCEKVNWYQHAHDVAMQGKRLDEDARLQACRKVETEINDGELDRGFKLGMHNYCKVESARDAGAKGLQFNYDFCDSNQIRGLRQHHTEGLKAFCNPENGFLYASKGGAYKNQCHAYDEAKFLAKFREGRKVYLTTRISNLRQEQSQLNREMTDIERQISGLSSNISRLDQQINRLQILAEREKDRKAKRAQNQKDGLQQADILTSSYDNRIQRLENDRSDLLQQQTQLRGRLNTNRDRNNQITQEIKETQTELAGLKSLKQTS